MDIKQISDPFFVEENPEKFFQWQILINLSSEVLLKIFIYLAEI